MVVFEHKLKTIDSTTQVHTSLTVKLIRKLITGTVILLTVGLIYASLSFLHHHHSYQSRIFPFFHATPLPFPAASISVKLNAKIQY